MRLGIAYSELSIGRYEAADRFSSAPTKGIEAEYFKNGSVSDETNISTSVPWRPTEFTANFPPKQANK